MKTITAIVLVSIAVLLTSAVWFAYFNDVNPTSQTNTNATPTPITTPAVNPPVYTTPQPSSTPTPTPTLQPAYPSVPEFSVKYVDRSYEDPPVYQKDPYTGENKLVWGGGHVTNKTVDIVITNQPFTPYKIADGKDVELHYQIRHKGHFEEWTEGSYSETIRASSSGTTTATYIVGKDTWWQVSTNSTVDIQIRAQIGYYSMVYDPYARPWDMRAVLNLAGESDWSSVQTVTIP